MDILNYLVLNEQLITGGQPSQDSFKKLSKKGVVVVVNLSAKKIGSFTSECLITGFYRGSKEVVLAVPEKKVSNGSLLV